MKDTTITSRPPRPIQVFCVDDNTDMLDMMKMMIDAAPMMECVGCLDCADELMQTVLGLERPPEIILLDATMPGKDPLAVLKTMSAKCRSIKTIVLSGYDDAAFVDRVKGAGAWGFLSKREEPETILLAVREAAEGKVMWPRQKTSS